MNTTPTLEMLDPATLTVDINVRKDAALTADFIASIKEHGVMEPVIAHRKDDGTVHVLMGQRRTRAAVEAGPPLHPGHDHRVPRGSRTDRDAGRGEHPARRTDRSGRGRRLPPAVPDRRLEPPRSPRRPDGPRPPSRAP